MAQGWNFGRYPLIIPALSNNLEFRLRVAETPQHLPKFADSAILFGPFCLNADRRLLLKDGRPVSIGTRALEILITLVDRAGELVTKDELVSRAWPNTVVEDSNLRAQVAALRKALRDEGSGSHYVTAVPGRGYRFVATISHSSSERKHAAVQSRKSNLPARLTRLIGRTDVVGALGLRLRRCRFVTIAGPGGIGKTTLALAVAAEALDLHRDGVWLFDLAALADPDLVPTVLASTLGFEITSDSPTEELINMLRDKQMLLVFDNCERVIAAVAQLVERILKSAIGTHILTTSREPLRAEGESVHRLAPLGIPPVMAGLTAAFALSFPAVELFIERSAANIDELRLSDADAPLVADICRQLDGLPLAIELAAGRVDAFGVRGVAEGLNDRFQLLSGGGRRTALPRHQALRATLDWSYELLTEPEQTVLRRLGAFARCFTLGSASAVTADSKIDDADFPGILANLISKSLVQLEVEDGVPRYRLLETMRAYSVAKLTESGELSAISRRHAEHFRRVFETALSEWETKAGDEWLACYGPETDNMRSALDWAFSAGGDTTVGMALTVAAIPLWFKLSSTDECRNRVEQALNRAEGADREIHTRQVLQLYIALGLSRTFTIGLAPAASAAWKKALEIAESLGDNEFKLETLWGLWFCHIGAAEYRAALDIAKQFCSLAETTPDLRIGERLIGVPLHCLGEHVEARNRIESNLHHEATPIKSSQGVRFRFNQPLAARVILAQMLWLQGFPDQAIEEAHRGVAEARAGGHAISLCDALAQAQCPIAMLVGDLSSAEQAVTTLLDQASLHALGAWSVLGCCWNGALLIKRGEFERGVSNLRSAIKDLHEVRFAFYHAGFLSTLAEGLASAGRFEAAIDVIDEAIERCMQKEELWCIAELLRIKGEILLKQASTDLSLAEDYFLRSGEWARKQGALSWELRAATSLSKLRCSQGHGAGARNMLLEIYERFSEGFTSSDLRTAKALIDSLSAC